MEVMEPRGVHGSQKISMVWFQLTVSMILNHMFEARDSSCDFDKDWFVPDYSTL